MQDFRLAREDSPQAVFAEGTVAGMRGERGAGFCRLILAVRLTISPVMETGAVHRPALTGLVADVFHGGVNLGRFTGFPWRLGIVQSPTVQADTRELYLECEVDSARLDAIEALRAGADLGLLIQFQGQVDGGRWQGGSVDHTVNQSAWAAVLADAGYRRTLLIEMPVPDPAAEPELAAAIAYLAQAQAHLLAGRDRDAVGACRDVLEELEKLPGAEFTEPSGDRNAWSKAERVLRLRKALTLLTHPARHRKEDAARIIWGRTYARAIITMTAGLMMEMSADEARQDQ
jgi:hypothetical protein